MVTLLRECAYHEQGADVCLFCARHLRDGDESAVVLTPLLSEAWMHRRCFFAVKSQVFRPGQRRWPLRPA